MYFGSPSDSEPLTPHGPILCGEVRALRGCVGGEAVRSTGKAPRFQIGCANAASRSDSAGLKIDDADNHGTARVAGEVLEAPAAVEGADAVVDGVRDHAEAPDFVRCADGSLEGEHQKRTGMALAVVIFVDRQLAEQRDRHRIRLVSLMRLRQERAFDLGRTQGDVANDLAGRGIADDVGAGDAGRVVRPSALTEPIVEGVATAVEAAAVVNLGERSRRRYRCHVGARAASSLMAGIS